MLRLVLHLALVAVVVLGAAIQEDSSLEPYCHGINVEYKEHLKKCVCAEGYHGDPEFFCSKKLDVFCTIKDPQVMDSFQDVTYFYDYPCVQKVAEIHMRLDGSHQILDLFLGASYDKNGALLLDFMGAIMGNVTFLFSEDTFKVNGTLAEMGQLPDEWADNLLKLDHQTWLFHVPGIQIMFRPYHTFSLKEKPNGFQISYQSKSHVHEVYELCSHVDGEFEDAVENEGYIYKEIYALKVSIDAYSQLSPQATALASGDTKDACDVVGRTYESCLIDQHKEMVNMCGPILTHSPIRMCLTFSGFKVLELFAVCSRAFCFRDENSCKPFQKKAILDCYPMAKNCHQL